MFNNHKAMNFLEEEIPIELVIMVGFLQISREFNERIKEFSDKYPDHQFAFTMSSNTIGSLQMSISEKD